MIDPVFQLIKSLTPSEKRHFRLFTNRHGSSDSLKFLQLFDAIDHLQEYDDEQILKDVPSIKKAQLANLKANLYKQLLSSLRLYHASQNIDIQLQEQLGHVRVLYNKGFYQQSLKLLERIKTTAKEAGFIHIALSAIEFEKFVELQHITRSIGDRAEDLSADAMDVVGHISQQHVLSNLALRMYGLYLKVGHARNKEDHEYITAYFKKHLPQTNINEGGFFEKLYYYQSHVWYYFLVQDFKACYRYAQKWVSLFEDNPTMLNRRTTLYLKGINNLLGALFNLLYHSKFKRVLQKLEDFEKDKERKRNYNIDMLLFLYISTNTLNLHFIEGTFDEGIRTVPTILSRLKHFDAQLDAHHKLVLYYKIASLYFGSGDYSKAIQYLNKIIQHKDVSLREDLQCFARILNLIAHYEAGKDELLEYQIKSVYHFLGKMNDQQQMQVTILKFLRSLGAIAPADIKAGFIDLREKLLAIAANPYERRPFLYLDILSWLESKIENLPVQEVMKRRAVQLK